MLLEDSMILDVSDPARTEVMSGFAALSARYDLIFCDVWGVLHNGLSAHAAAGDALMRVRARGGKVVLVSNAPRPGAVVASQLDRIGVPREAYDAIVTSGDLTRAVVIERQGQVVYHLGPDRDRPIFKGLDVGFSDIEGADYVVCTGLFDDDRETVDDYRERLCRMRERDLWMVCANPDIVVERGDQLVVCAGALAVAYEGIGGEVYYAGKPHRPIYEAAARLAGEPPVPRERILAIGDAIRTDIAGARGFGIDSLLVLRGIHGAELKLDEAPLTSARVEEWLQAQAVRPQAVAEMLSWS